MGITIELSPCDRRLFCVHFCDECMCDEDWEQSRESQLSLDALVGILIQSNTILSGASALSPDAASTYAGEFDPQTRSGYGKGIKNSGYVRKPR